MEIWEWKGDKGKGGKDEGEGKWKWEVRLVINFSLVTPMPRYLGFGTLTPQICMVSL
jgi:hypothetical protein